MKSLEVSKAEFGQSFLFFHVAISVELFQERCQVDFRTIPSTYTLCFGIRLSW